jgi:hypothetical protein
VPPVKKNEDHLLIGVKKEKLISGMTYFKVLAKHRCLKE